jgi:sporulation protein YlmC with PRC-barrel domain
MTHYGTLRDYRFSDTAAEDIRGSAIYGVDDDKLGKIDDVIFDHSTGDIRYVIVDTGGWLKSKKFMVPADRLQPSSEHKDDYYVALTKSQIEAFPPYDENAVKEQRTWSDYETRYRGAWTDAPVQHREGTDRNITPATGTAPYGSGTEYSRGGTLGQRWSAFENRLRTDRSRIVAECGFCGRGAGSERVDRERKIS